MRMDGAFFREDVLEVLEHTPGLGYAIKVPFYRWLGLKELIAHINSHAAGRTSTRPLKLKSRMQQ